MKKSRVRARGFKGAITAFASLLFLVLLSLVGAIFESAFIHIQKSQNIVDVSMALESVFAEYQKELFEEYGILGRLGSDEAGVSARLAFYGAGEMKHHIEKLCLLSDEQGSEFYRQAVQYEKEYLGLSDFSFGTELDFEEEGCSLDEIEDALEQEDVLLPESENPIGAAQSLANKDLLSLLFVDSSELSSKSISLDNLPTNRKLSKGNWQKSNAMSLSDKAFFVAYLKEHFSNKVNKKEERKLDYEMEYLIGGRSSDRQNLSAVCERILQIRTVANYGYLLTDSTKKAEAKTLATALSILMEAPAVEGVLEQGILIAWAYGEGIVDVRGLLKGNRIPLMKTASSWQLQLSNLGTIGTSNEATGEKSLKDGLSYQDYLTGLLLLEKAEQLSMRSLDLIESNLQIKTDQCITKIQIESETTLRRGIIQKFKTTYGYQ